jgi:hypothetical protein
MTYAAQINTNNVVENIAIFSSPEDVFQGWVIYNTDNPAVISGDYVEGFFYSPQPFPSWTRNEGLWIPPSPLPNDGNEYVWDEDSLSWVGVES